VAEKLAVVAPATAVTDDGTVTAAVLLDKLTDWPPAPAAALSVTVHVSVPAPVIDAAAQVTPMTVGCRVRLGVAKEVLFGNVPTHPSRLNDKGKTKSARMTALRELVLQDREQCRPSEWLRAEA
jgi:hypothetical protein